LAASGPSRRILARSTAAFSADACAHLEREETVLAPVLSSRRYVLAPPVIRILCAEHHALAASRAVARGLAARLPKAVLAAEPTRALLAQLAAATQALAGHLSITDLLFPLVLRLERDGALR
jgi:iron-sulfur cluster repair protein YtfE (RIC family)